MLLGQSRLVRGLGEAATRDYLLSRNASPLTLEQLPGRKFIYVFEEFKTIPLYWELRRMIPDFAVVDRAIAIIHGTHLPHERERHTIRCVGTISYWHIQGNTPWQLFRTEHLGEKNYLVYPPNLFSPL
jgi:hypothetical protein